MDHLLSQGTTNSWCSEALILIIVLFYVSGFPANPSFEPMYTLLQKVDTLFTLKLFKSVNSLKLCYVFLVTPAGQRNTD
jgi:hypothetical protein